MTDRQTSGMPERQTSNTAGRQTQVGRKATEKTSESMEKFEEQSTVVFALIIREPGGGGGGIPPERRHGSTRVPVHASLHEVAHDGVLCTFSNMSAPDRTSGVVRQGRRHGPSITNKIIPCWVLSFSLTGGPPCWASLRLYCTVHVL
jgi:hypothetical protein